MVWRDQDPPATDVLLDFTVPFSGGGTPAYLEIDKLPEGLYRARGLSSSGTEISIQTSGTTKMLENMCFPTAPGAALAACADVHNRSRELLSVWREHGNPGRDVFRTSDLPNQSFCSAATQTPATVGTLFEYQELCRTGNLEGLLRHARAVAVSRSFDDMVRAIRAMRSLDDSVH